MPSRAAADRHFREMYAAHGAAVLTYFKRRTDAETARDCTAETFLVAWRRIDEVPPEPLPWLYGVARNVLANQSRSRRRMARLVGKLAGMGPESSPDPEMVVVRRADETALVEAINRLRPPDREILLLACWEELPHAEIGEILGCSAHAVDQRMYRATRRLQKQMTGAGTSPAGTTTPQTESRGGLQ